jgi:hypothetical protein
VKVVEVRPVVVRRQDRREDVLIGRLARDPALRARMGKKGRERVLPRYAVKRLVDDVDELYRSLLSAGGERRR